MKQSATVCIKFVSNVFLEDSLFKYFLNYLSPPQDVKFSFEPVNLNNLQAVQIWLRTLLQTSLKSQQDNEVIQICTECIWGSCDKVRKHEYFFGVGGIHFLTPSNMWVYPRIRASAVTTLINVIKRFKIRKTFITVRGLKCLLNGQTCMPERFLGILYSIFDENSPLRSVI